MPQADFAYGPGRGDALALTAAIYSARLGTAAEMREDAATAGYGIADYDLLAELDECAPAHPGDVLYVDCPVQDGATLAALSHLDQRAAASGIPLVVTTSMTTLEAVFGCLDTARAELLVEPTRGDRVLALARAVTKVPGMSVRQFDQHDKAAIARLTEQVAQIAAQIDRLAEGEGRAFRLGSPGDEFRGDVESERQLIRPPRPPLPDPRLVRKIIRQRQLRGQFLSPELFADPAWDILLDLTAARAEHSRVSVTSLCIASGVPPTTALRWISQMTETGLLVRVEDDSDRRRAFIELSDKAADAMARYFHELGKEGKALV